MGHFLGRFRRGGANRGSTRSNTSVRSELRFRGSRHAVAIEAAVDGGRDGGRASVTWRSTIVAAVFTVGSTGWVTMPFSRSIRATMPPRYWRDTRRSSPLEGLPSPRTGRSTTDQVLDCGGCGRSPSRPIVDGDRRCGRDITRDRPRVRRVRVGDRTTVQFVDDSRERRSCSFSARSRRSVSRGDRDGSVGSAPV